MWWVILIAGVVGVLLGGLWLIQGLGLVEIQPILCLAECEPIRGGSALWAAVGALVLAAGAYALVRSFRPRGF